MAVLVCKLKFFYPLVAFCSSSRFTAQFSGIVVYNPAAEVRGGEGTGREVRWGVYGILAASLCTEFTFPFSLLLLHPC